MEVREIAREYLAMSETPKHAKKRQQEHRKQIRLGADTLAFNEDFVGGGTRYSVRFFKKVTR